MSSVNYKLMQFVHGVSKKEDISEEILEYVAEGVLKYLTGNKTPWPKKRGRKGFPKTKDYEIWLEYRQSNLSRTRGGELLDNLSEKYNLSDSGIYDSVRRVQKLADEAYRENNLDANQTPFGQLSFRLTFCQIFGTKLGMQKFSFIKANNYFVKDSSTSSK